jgi:hypothetical protein
MDNFAESTVFAPQPTSPESEHGGAWPLRDDVPGNELETEDLEPEPADFQLSWEDPLGSESAYSAESIETQSWPESIKTIPRMASVIGGWISDVAGGTPAMRALAERLIKAGVNTENDLTDIIFRSVNPQVGARKLNKDNDEDRRLREEWARIRANVVRPALKKKPAGRPYPQGDKSTLSSSQLKWWGEGMATPELLTFMKAVYNRQVELSEGVFVADLPRSEVAEIEDGKYARKDAAAAARELLAAARATLTAEGLAGTTRIGVTSGYRSAARQFDIWQGKDANGKGGFPYYYRITAAARQRFPDEHGPEAVELLANYIRDCIAAPGYSNHQDGLALDFGVGRVGGGLGRIKAGSWFHNWLTAHAHSCGFFPYLKEAWHWVFRPGAAASQPEITEEWSGEEPGEFWELADYEADAVNRSSSKCDGDRLSTDNITREFMAGAEPPEPEDDFETGLDLVPDAAPAPPGSKHSARPDLDVTTAQISAYDGAFKKSVGLRFKELVEGAAKEVDLNPGLVAVNLIAEAPLERYMTKKRVSTYDVGADDFYIKRQDIEAKVSAFKKLRWDEMSKRSHNNDAQKPREIVTVDFYSGRDALLGNAVYVKHGEVVLREAAHKAGKEFDALPVEVRFALVRLACNAGHGRALRNLAEALSGRDVLIRKRQKKAGPQRRATIHAARAMHLSSWIFGVTPR